MSDQSRFTPFHHDDDDDASPVFILIEHHLFRSLLFERFWKENYAFRYFNDIVSCLITYRCDINRFKTLMIMKFKKKIESVVGYEHRKSLINHAFGLNRIYCLCISCSSIATRQESIS